MFKPMDDAICLPNYDIVIMTLLGQTRRKPEVIYFYYPTTNEPKE